MFNKNTALALLILAAGLAATTAHAGQGTVMLGSTGFADRCQDNGGQLFDTGNRHACQLPTTLVECMFSGAYAACAWNGVQTKIEVVRLLGGMVTTDSIASDGSDTVGKAVAGGGDGGGGPSYLNEP